MATREQLTAARLARTQKMAEMHRQGVTMKKIGDQYSMTRERVRQLLAEIGITAKDGGRSAFSSAKSDAQAKKEARYLAKFGFSVEAMTQMRKDRVTHAYGQQRSNAIRRGIAWEISFFDWVTLWQRSGKWGMRGRGAGRFVMSRIGDKGGYRVGNVHIQLSTENNSEFIRAALAERRKSEVVGVYLQYPGCAKPWLAKLGRSHLGFFATQQDAAAARAAFIAQNPERRIRSRGYAIIRGKNGRPDRYQVMVGRKYIGLFKTPEEALAARSTPTTEASNA